MYVVFSLLEGGRYPEASESLSLSFINNYSSLMDDGAVPMEPEDDSDSGSIADDHQSDLDCSFDLERVDERIDDDESDDEEYHGSDEFHEMFYDDPVKQNAIARYRDVRPIFFC